jgi:hypothetical protein
MGSLPIASRRERSTGLVHPSGFHIRDQLMCIAGTVPQALSTTTSVPYRRWSARFGNAASPCCAGQSGLALNAFKQARLCGMLLSPSGFPPGKPPPQRSFALNLSFLQKESNTRLCGAPAHGIYRYTESPVEQKPWLRLHSLLHDLDSLPSDPGSGASRRQRSPYCGQAGGPLRA